MTRCPECGGEVVARSAFCPGCGSNLVFSRSPTEGLELETVAECNASTDPLDHCRFSPGTILAGRFRIVTALGSGGMGEVFRAEDLKLRQEVALKFLPAGLAGDPNLLARFHREVRLARRVSHPNVCRVYDIVEAEGQHFVAMEFIDGEDLASLLARVGRLGVEKALEVSKQICAGLGAVHEQGVVHRDLKPANIMIDGRGRARLTDFGLATPARESGERGLVGTPAYMSPEQIAGREVTAASDLYALGLVLFEVFTGRPVFSADSPAEVLRLRREAVPQRPGDIRENMDPAVERLILRCLEEDPGGRPASALAVAAALPGGDPLVAMLAAGETPPPELVAASGRRGLLTGSQALWLTTVIVVGLVLWLWFIGHESMGDLVGGLLPPQVLEHQAGQILSELGYDERAADTAWGFDLDAQVWPGLRDLSATEIRAVLRSEERPAVRFWYRQSPSPMSPWHTSLPGPRAGDIVTPDDPPLDEPGMVFMRLSPRGRLLEFEVVPGGPSLQQRPEEQVFSKLLSAAGVDEATAQPVVPSSSLPFPGCSRAAWEAPAAFGANVRLRIEAAFVGPRPVSARVTPVEDAGEDVPVVRRQAGPASHVFDLVFFGFLVGGAVLALVNLRSGRWDRKGSIRLGVAVFVVCFLSVVLGAHHTFTSAEEARRAFSAVAYGATRALMTFLLYVAIEPFIRRLHPTALISWSRLLAGRVSDPAVGRDALIGGAVAGAQSIVLAVWFVLRRTGIPPFPVMAFVGEEGCLTAAPALAMALRAVVVSLGNSLGFILVFVGLRSALGRARWAAPVVLWLLLALLYGSQPLGLPASGIDRFVAPAVISAAITFLVVRCGLLAASVGLLFVNLFAFSIVTIDPSDWYVAPTAIIVILALALIAFGVRTSTASKRLLPSARE